MLLRGLLGESSLTRLCAMVGAAFDDTLVGGAALLEEGEGRAMIVWRRPLGAPMDAPSLCESSAPTPTL